MKKIGSSLQANKDDEKANKDDEKVTSTPSLHANKQSRRQ